MYYGIIATLVGIVLSIDVRRGRGEYDETPVRREENLVAPSGHDERRP